MPYVRADGHNDAKRVSLLEVRGDDAIETFDVFQGLLAPPADGVHRLLVRQPEGASRRIEVAAIGLAARKAQIAVPTVANAPAWTWTMREDGIAVLGVAQFPARVKCALLGWSAWKDAVAHALTNKEES